MKLGRKADKLKSDLGSKECGKEIAAGIKGSAFGGGKIDIIIHNGAISLNKTLLNMDVEVDYTEQMNINVRSVLLITQVNRLILLSCVFSCVLAWK